MQITLSDVLKLIGTLAAAKNQYNSESRALFTAHKVVERYLKMEIEFEIKPDLFDAGTGKLV